MSASPRRSSPACAWRTGRGRARSRARSKAGQVGVRLSSSPSRNASATMDYLLDLLRLASVLRRPRSGSGRSCHAARRGARRGGCRTGFLRHGLLFLESTGFLLAIVVLVAVFGFIDRRRSTSTSSSEPVITALVLVSLHLQRAAPGQARSPTTTRPRGPAYRSAWPRPRSASPAAGRSSRGSARLDAEAAGALPLYAGDGAAGVRALDAASRWPFSWPRRSPWLLVGGHHRQGEEPRRGCIGASAVTGEASPSGLVSR